MEASDLALLLSLDALLQESSVSGAARRVGLSTPAMSHALARVRERLGDELLVRSGRGMLLTPRAVELAPLVAQVVADARRVFEPQRPFVPSELARTFVVHASDYVLSVVGGAVDRLLREAAPGVSVQFVPNTPDDAALLRDQGSDLAVGIYGALPQEMRSRQLLTDRFVCVLRAGHPAAAEPLTLERYVALRHVQVAPRGQPGGYVDDVLREAGLSRAVARAVPYFLTALQLAAETDYVLTVSERIATRHAEALGLVVREAPLPLRPYALSLVWHPRVDGDAGHRFLRDVFVRASGEAAAERHEAPRTRLDPTDPTSGETRKRARRRPTRG
ncbi:MAG: LysR family transcriptional regulator [Deltaproteobacteria bacterium]|nr:LysR family transcriptional regulator [Deltaproteobacteria bacterium]